MGKTMLKVHRVLGTILSLFFLLWFSTGFVMLFRSFPSVQEQETLKALPPLYLNDTQRDSLGWSPVEAHLQTLPQSLQGLSLEAQSTGQGYVLSWQHQGKSAQWHSLGNSGYTLDDLLHRAQRYKDKPIARYEYIEQPDTWLPYDRPGRFPAYRFYYDDEAKTEIYLSLSSAELLQSTDRSSRLWAYLGAIPHWIYPYQLRQNRGAWVAVVSVLSGLGVVMCLSGLILGIKISWRSRHRSGLRSPYKHKFYRWHHYLGLLFGLGASAFVFSGFMSVQEVPDWLIPQHKAQQTEAEAIHFNWSPEALLHTLDLVKGVEQASSIRRIELRALGALPYLKVSSLKQNTYYRLSQANEALRPLRLSRDEVEAYVQNLSPGVQIQTDLLTSYDNYYIDRHHDLPLPVYRVDVADADGSTYYINPQTGEWRYYNRNSKLRRLLYGGLHSWIFAPLIERPYVWWPLIFFLLIGGWGLSATGLLLSFPFRSREKA